ncbi:hypothetical protein D8674_005376 [Pyrus ussuriensis x Pyrus communis]|uniref:Uncharacterized protein n=1 Tax=Pyrus ussuriensis x Pyrus communis TaxID=2448454 RepID=A0A5N5FR97_9ROSA|nr:hypothetical protein D8674_005376 [Pyrus ussuriensis x Pyrus communis]
MGSRFKIQQQWQTRVQDGGASSYRKAVGHGQRQCGFPERVDSGGEDNFGRRSSPILVQSATMDV